MSMGKLERTVHSIWIRQITGERLHVRGVMTNTVRLFDSLCFVIIVNHSLIVF